MVVVEKDAYDARLKCLEDALRESTAALGRLHRAHQKELAALQERNKDMETALKMLAAAYQATLRNSVKEKDAD